MSFEEWLNLPGRDGKSSELRHVFRQVLEVAWLASRAEALKEAAEIARTFQVMLAAPDRDGSAPRGLVRANFEIAEAIEANTVTIPVDKKRDPL